MYWEDLSTRDFETVDRSTPVILNVAAVEQHGPHLPVDTDVAIGGYFLERLDERLGDSVLILPQMKVCCSAHHISFPGTLTVSHETFLAYGYDVLASVAVHGFRNIVVLNSHGGNQGIGRVLVEKFGARHPQCRAAFFTWWTMAGKELAEVRESAPFGVGHGCEFETSVMLRCRPDSVRRSLIEGLNFVPSLDWADGDMLRAARGYVYRPLSDTSGGKGYVGDPSLASAEKGEAITTIVVDRLADIVKSLAAS